MNNKLQIEREKNLKQLEDFTAEKIKLQEMTSSAETKAKDFEYLLSELEYKVNSEKASSKEDDLRQEVKRLKAEIDQMGSHQDLIKSESTDLVSELKALRFQLEESNQKVSSLDFFLKQAGLEKEKNLIKFSHFEKEIGILNEKIKDQDKIVIQLTKKNVELEALHTQALERKDQEFLQVLKKSHLEMQILQDQLEKVREEQEAIAIRTRNETFALPNFDQFQRPGSHTLNFDFSGGLSQPQPTYTSSGMSEEQTNVEDTVFDKDKQLELPDDFRNEGVQAQMTTSGFVRRETQDSKALSSMNQSRRGSTMSNRLAMRTLAFGAGKNTDEKLVAEVNELKIKLKEAHQETATKVSSLLVELFHLGRT